MQQYFIDKYFKENDIVDLNKEDLYHLVKVLRKDSNYKFRVVNNKGEIFFCHLVDLNRVLIDSFCNENNELDVDITCVLSLIKSDKFEFIIQKLVELGVNRIVPLNTNRCVSKIKDDKKLERLKTIIKEASQQSHRNIIPVIENPINIKDLINYKSDLNYLCYESESFLNNEIINSKSITYIIGPEGGFEEKEVELIKNLGFKSISLGKRILRAETAAIYISSVIVSKCQ